MLKITIITFFVYINIIDLKYLIRICKQLFTKFVKYVKKNQKNRNGVVVCVPSVMIKSLLKSKLSAN